jgi:hypothetical protein
MNMSTITRHSDTCQVKQVSSNKLVEAVVQDFNECEMLTVVLNKSVKLSMKWNGRVYEGHMAGMDFISNGPTVSKTQTGIRG